MRKRFFRSLLAISLAILTALTISVSVQAAEALYWPVPGHGETSGTYSDDHPAIDIQDSSVNGAAIIAAMGGKVHRMWNCAQQHYGDLHNCSGFGTGMVIQGYDGRFYQYAHMQAGSIPGHFYVGADVSTGEVIGRVGTTGNSSGPHLHFGISNGSSWHPANVNPVGENYIYTVFWPVPACTTISQGYSDSHPGISISGPNISGAAVVNAASGEVVKVYNCAEQHYGDMHDCNGYGTGVILRTWDGKYYHYAHLEPNSIPSNVQVGNWIIAEAPLGRVGATGNSAGPNLYFAVSSSSMYEFDVDPMDSVFTYTVAIPVSVRFGESTRTSIGETNAVLASILTTTGASINNVSEVGIELYNPDGSLLATKREVPVVSGSYISMFYYTDSELGVTLMPGTTYSYQFHAILNNEIFYSDTLFFTTTGTTHVHSFGAWNVTIEPGCELEGEMTRTCACGVSEKKAIDPTGHSWKLQEEQAADCLNPSRRIEICENCDETQTIFGDVQWSEWSEEYPENISDQLVAFQTQYRYRDLETVISDSETMDGYELVDVTWLDPVEYSVDYVISWPYGFNSTHGLYAQYNNSPAQVGETAYQKTTELSNNVVGYLYYHWCRGSYTGGPIDRQVRAEYEDGYAAFHAFYSTTDPATLGRDGTGLAYHYANGSCCKDSYWYFCVPVYRQTYAVQQLGYVHGRWGQWSEWSFDWTASSETREVESRKVYRHVTGGLGGHDYENHVCKVCGTKEPDYIPVIATGWSGATQWTLTEDGVLTVYGEGVMKNYDYNEKRPWQDYADRITSVVIEEGVTRVGACAFKDMTALESVSLPETGLKTIGEAAFYGCSSLKELYIPDTVYTIWEYTFKNCTALENIRLPKTLEKIDQGAFENCSALSYVFFPGELEIIGGWSFKACTALTEIDMQWVDATEIRAGAFKNCTALEEIILPANIQVLGDSCFYGIGAEKFVVPDTVTSIDAWCFARSAVKQIVFEGDAPSIGEGAFNAITLTASYPDGNTTWTSAKMQDYGGTVTWKAN